MKKSLTRLLALILAVMMVCAFTLPAYAATANDDTYSGSDESEDPVLEPEEPSTDSGDKSDKTPTPKTGDNTSMLLYIVLMVVSAVALVAIVATSRRSFKRK